MIQRKTVERLARLARLDLEPGEIDRLRDEIIRILGFVDEIEGIDALDAAPGAGREGAELGDRPGAEGSRLRDDRPVDYPPDRLLDLAPGTRGRMIVVPRVFGGPKR